MTTDWPTAFAAALREVDPTVDADKAEAAMREAFLAPRPRDPLEDELDNECWRCKGSREIPYGNDPLGRDLYDPCPECDPEA